MEADDPVAGVRLNGPATGIDLLEERYDAGRRQVRHASERAGLGYGLELGEGRPEGQPSASSRTVRSARPSSIIRRFDLPSHRRERCPPGRSTSTQPSAGKFSGAADRVRRPRGSSSSSATGRAAGGVQSVERGVPRRRASPNGAQTIAEASGKRPDLEGHLGDDAQRAHRAGQELGEVVAGDVLDDPSAPLDLDPLRGHEADADDLVARPAQAEPARAAGVGGEDASERGPIGLGDVDQQSLVLRRPEPTGGPTAVIPASTVIVMSAWG